MAGFFNLSELRETRPPGKSSPILGCESCGLYRGCITTDMKPSGKGLSRTLILGEAPGKTEDEEGVQFVGEVGSFLRKILTELKTDPNRDFFFYNSVNCRPPKNRTPKPVEVAACRSRVFDFIRSNNIKFVIALGNSALESLFPGRKGLSINLYRKHFIPHKELSCWVIPLHHPSFIKRQRDDFWVSTYRRDLQWALLGRSMFGEFGEGSVFDPERHVTLLTKTKDVIDLLESLHSRERVFFDYETTSLNPFERGQFVWSVGVAVSGKEGYSFPLHHPEAQRPLSPKSKHPQVAFEPVLAAWKALLENPGVKKMAHHLKYEDLWSRAMGINVRGWEACTMTDQHVIDDRQGSKGLKFQAFVRWGVADYAEKVAPYMVVQKGSSRNRLGGVPFAVLGLYNGADAVLGFRLAEEQGKIFNRVEPLRRAKYFFLDGLLALADSEWEGIRVSREYYEEQDRAMAAEIADREKRILQFTEARTFFNNNRREVNIRSSKDLRELFYRQERLPIVKETATGAASVDEEALKGVDSPFARELLAIRKLEKMKGTYLAGFLRCETNGRLHPQGNLHIARSYRGSSENPNIQNVPVRDEDAKKITRSGIFGEEGCALLEVDYKAIEVRIAACLTKDPALIKYIHNEDTDMHRDQAREIFLLEEGQVSKKIRFHTKNGFVFPEFYGSTYRRCAENLWEIAPDLELSDGTPLLKHLHRQKLRNVSMFTDHMKTVERKMWTKFHVFKDWQKEVIDFYRRRGYVELPMGFRRSGYLTINEIINTPIQGTAFHCLLWSYVRISKELKERELRSRIKFQVHDSLITNLYPAESENVRALIRGVMCNRIRKELDFIIVPLDIEEELTPVNGSWYEKKAI